MLREERQNECTSYRQFVLTFFAPTLCEVYKIRKDLGVEASYLSANFVMLVDIESQEDMDR